MDKYSEYDNYPCYEPHLSVGEQATIDYYTDLDISRFTSRYGKPDAKTLEYLRNVASEYASRLYWRYYYGGHEPSEKEEEYRQEVAEQMIKNHDLYPHIIYEFYAQLNGSVMLNGLDVALTQGVYVDQVQRNIFDEPEVVYCAPAIDRQGDQYLVTWRLVDNASELTDAEDHCDWDNPISITQI